MLTRRSNHTATLLIAFDRFEQRSEVTLAEAFVPLALDDLEEDRPDARLREDLQELPRLHLRVRVDEDAVRAHALEILAVARDALVDHLVVRVRHIHELEPVRA